MRIAVLSSKMKDNYLTNRTKLYDLSEATYRARMSRPVRLAAISLKAEVGISGSHGQCQTSLQILSFAT
jgi:hypothetical protein